MRLWLKVLAVVLAVVLAAVVGVYWWQRPMLLTGTGYAAHNACAVTHLAGRDNPDADLPSNPLVPVLRTATDPAGAQTTILGVLSRQRAWYTEGFGCTVAGQAPDLPDPTPVDAAGNPIAGAPAPTPGPAVEAALELRQVLAEAGLTGFPKTSGGRGIHVFAPIRPADFIDARHAAIAVGRELARRMPSQVTVNWWKEERGERIFVDFNQMARDRLMTSAYSIRPTPRGLVSAPLTWEELPDVSPSDFTLLTMPERFARIGDLWQQLEDATPASLATALEWYEPDAAAGEGEMPYPPEYPKMPGEPPRVQPSKKNPDNWD